MQLIAEKRTKLGKKTNELRLERKLPAVVFGKGLQSMPVCVELNAFLKVYRQAGETELVDLKMEAGSQKVLIKQIQLDPVNMRVIHVNFHQVNLKEKIKADIPVEIVGEEENALIKSKEALALVLLNTIEVEALPADLPHDFTLDISGLTEIGAGLTIADLKYDKEKVELGEYAPDALVVKLDYAVQPETEEEADEAALLENLEATEEKTPVGGDETAEE